ncbi:Uncharacterized protein dnm_060190 [Desulfonema magnum]|uniref:Uncharacterized protein n=1 Tax=Desulfonema magnum TaxID=45655 RepID=A0A975BR01_9BACT|nr:Uncharacterized protein dnm_060190 [Desulfonema magnum]
MFSHMFSIIDRYLPRFYNKSTNGTKDGFERLLKKFWAMSQCRTARP